MFSKNVQSVVGWVLGRVLSRVLLGRVLGFASLNPTYVGMFCKKGLQSGLTLCLALLSSLACAGEAPGHWWVHVHNDRPLEVRALLARGVDPNIRTDNGQPALMRAVTDQAWQVFDVLAANPRTDLNIENPAGETPLMYLAIVGQTERAKTLIARGAKVNRLGWTPLHYAASRGQIDTARLLLDQGAMPNAPAPEGRTPLMMAAYSGKPDMVQLLLDRGADPSTRDSHGKDAADWAGEGKWGALAAELRRIIDVSLNQRETWRSGLGEAEPTAGARNPVQADKAPQPEDRVRPELQGVSGVRLGGN